MARCLFFCRAWCKLLARLTILTLLGIPCAYGSDRTICNELARQIEFDNGLPHNILKSIALVEAGRRDSDGLLKPWPWALNHAGKSLFFDTKSDALLYLNNHISAKFKNIDVGCMQINVRWHKENFSSFDAMIDPQSNIQYAAKFLSNLKEVHGNWEDAIKHYHSSTPKLNVKYFAKVEKAWLNIGRNTPITRNAILRIDEKNIYLGNRSPLPKVPKLNKKKNLDANRQEMLNSSRDENNYKDNEIYLNATLIENNEMFDKLELKRYIKYNSAYLGKNIDMILLFREEFSKN